MFHESANESTIRYIENRLRSILEECGTDDRRPGLRELLKKIYRDAFPERSDLQAGDAADTILETVQNYEEEYRTAVKAPDQWMKDFTTRELQDRSLEEQYDILLRHFIIQREIVSKSAGIQVPEEEGYLGDILHRLESGRVCIDDSGNELLQDILGRITRLHEGSVAVFGRCEEAIRAAGSRIEHMEMASLSGRQLRSLEECLAVAAMIGYTGCRSGQIPGVPEEVSIRQITYEVCGGMEMARIAEEMQNGSLTLEAAGKLLKLAGSIVCGFISQELISLKAAAGCFLLGGAVSIVVSAGAAAWVLLRLRDFAQKGKDAVKNGFYRIRSGVRTLTGWIGERITAAAGRVLEQTTVHLDRILEEVLLVDENIR